MEFVRDGVCTTPGCVRLNCIIVFSEMLFEEIYLFLRENGAARHSMLYERSKSMDSDRFVQFSRRFLAFLHS